MLTVAPDPSPVSIRPAVHHADGWELLTFVFVLCGVVFFYLNDPHETVFSSVGAIFQWVSGATHSQPHVDVRRMHSQVTR